MKTVGIVGGIGPESTIEYYRFIIAAYRAQEPTGSYPSIIINSVDVQKLLRWMGANDLPAVIEYLAGAVQRLAQAGADFALLAANTPHIVFNELQQRSPIPLLSIVEATCAAAQALQLTRVGLFGTRFTMQARFYPDTFARAGITLVLPAAAEQAYIHEKYVSELLNNIFLPATRDGLLTIIDRMQARDEIQGLILGGTELPLILRDAPPSDVTFLDTTQIHVAAAVAQLLA